MTLLALTAGPQIRTVMSSEALAIMSGRRGFQWTQFTVRVWPSRVTRGCSCFTCHTYTLLSNTHQHTPCYLTETPTYTLSDTNTSQCIPWARFFYWNWFNLTIHSSSFSSNCVKNYVLFTREKTSSDNNL